MIENSLFSPHILVSRPRSDQGNPFEVLDENYHAKSGGTKLPYGENFVILT